MKTTHTFIPPGAWLGVLGGGQLGRMFVHAAQAMGYKVCVLDPAPDCPAAQAADDHLIAAYDDTAALDAFAKKVRAVTTEFENVPAESLRRLAQRIPVAPRAEAVSVAQDRRKEKAFFLSLPPPAGEGWGGGVVAEGVLGVGAQPSPEPSPRGRGSEIVGPHAAIENERSDFAHVKFPAILKTATLGYDGKGQKTIETAPQVLEAWRAFGSVPCMLEERIDLALEVSVLVARNASGETRVFPIQENQHRNGILDVTIVPARIDESLRARAVSLAEKVVNGLDYVGVLCIEIFVTKCGELLLNEIAPRPHNSGHYSIEACETSQFAQQVRAMVNAPLGDTRLLTPAVMVNVLGDCWSAGEPAWSDVLAVPGAHVHLYGKADAKPGRKMGHVTCTAPTLDEALQRAARVKQLLKISA
jgi:5-(carboxyamino)imidazole ribonucleotide synthase